MILKSEIKAITVYKDRALVERIAKANLSEGDHLLIFEALPADIDTNSIQISGGKQAVLQDIKLKDVYLDKISDEGKSVILEEIEELEDLIEELNDRINNSNEEKSFLLNLANVSAETTKKSLLALFVPEKMQDMLKFYSEKLNALDDTIRNNKKELKKLEKRLQTIKAELNKYSKKNLSTEKHVELKVYAKESREMDFILSYVVMNASWVPIYDLRLDSDEKILSIAYNALIKQRTGEKWDNVKLNLSTARPQISGDTPKLNTWFIDIFRYSPPMAASALKAKKETSRSLGMKIAPEGILDDEFEESDEAPIEIVSAKVETAATSVVFSIPGNNSISDNYEEHKLGITQLFFDAELEYNSVPKLSPFAYLTAIASNNSEFPLLAGKTNIFLDNSFVAHSKLKLVAPNEKFITSLGVDEGIHIEHKLLNRFAKEEGVFSKKGKKLFEFKILVKNNKKLDCKIKIKDQIPISQNQDVKVELLEPKIKENSESLKKMDDGTIEWVLNLNPAEKAALNLKFSVEYPKEESLVGIE